MKLHILIFSMIFLIQFSVDAKKVDGYYINIEGDTIETIFKVKFNMITGHPDYSKIASGVYQYENKEKILLDPETCRGLGFSSIGGDFIFISVPNKFKHILKVYSKNVFMSPKILGPVNLYYSTYTQSYSSMGVDGSWSQSSIADLGWILQKHNGLTLNITYGSARKKDLIRFFCDWEELENLFDEKELSKNNTVKIVEAYNNWYAERHGDVSVSNESNIHMESNEDDFFDEP